MAHDPAMAGAETLDGKLVVLSSMNELDAETVVARDKALADIERGFRVRKQDIAIAPVDHRQRHQGETRTGITTLSAEQKAL